MLIDNWIKIKIGLNEADAFTREKLEEFQLFKLIEILERAKEHSLFYKDHLMSINPRSDIKALSDITKIPFTTPQMLMDQGSKMICVSQGEISRIVTLDTSGTTGNPKRVFFTEEDQELTMDYFHYGMRVMTTSKDVFLVLLPCKTPGSVGDLLRMGLERDGIKVIPFSYPNPDGSDDDEVIDLIKREKVSSMVGTPTTIVRLASKSAGEIKTVRTVLLSAEYVSQESVDLIEDAWGCEVFEHFGMTETGLGGAMACSAHKGYHPREADLFFEIIDPESGEVLPEGELGELVFTTLTRTGMPFIRYRTGDITRWIPDECPCGSILKRFDRVNDRQMKKGY